MSYVLQDDDGQILGTHSVSAGLDYASVGPEHAFLHKNGRVLYSSINDEQALDAFYKLSRLEGIIPALETSHAIAYAEQLAVQRRPDQSLLINLSGRGDKDMHTVAAREGIQI